ncbi:MAG: protein kinase [Gemmatimonadaceae bacterium]|nr:protein kinase [Gemmatimonadaceae bacterium]
MAEPLFPASDSELRAHVERVLSDGYELDREIGRGGMGIVYLARDRRLKRQVAVKLLPPELAFRAEIRSRFLREAETAAQLGHPNIVPIYSVDEREGLVFFVMAYVDGENLAMRLHRDGAMPGPEVRRILIDVARALSYAHERGVVHRDIKPDNILIDSGGRVMVTDFGIARAVTEGADARLTATGMAIGTPAYMSPEQSMGEREVDGRSDLYSLGIVGYQMLSGELPFNASSTPALLVKHLSEVPPPIEERCPGVEPDLGRAIMLLLEKEPANRLPSASALAAALESGNVPDARGNLVARPVTTPSSARAPAANQVPRPLADVGFGAISAEEARRWSDAKVIAFRKGATPWAFFGVAAIILSAFGVIDVVGLWGMWTIFIAWKYAKLWTDGFDWRDVMKEPRDRMFFDVVADWVDSVRAIWDPRKRAEVRERERLKNERTSALAAGDVAPIALPGGASPASLSSVVGRYARAVQDAARNREEILRLMQTLPKKDQQLLREVPSGAAALYQKIEALAVALGEAERALPDTPGSEIDNEIARLESEANPLDTQGSDERVRRLAYLKRQRRAVAEIEGRTKTQREKLESCAIALQNMRLDIVRLKAGSQTFEHITSVAEQAVALAREVDTAMYVKDEMSKLSARRAGSVRRQ